MKFMNPIFIATIIVVLIIVFVIIVVAIYSHIVRSTCKKQGHDWNDGKCKRCSVDKLDFEKAIEWESEGWKEYHHHPGPDDSYNMRAEFSKFGRESYADDFKRRYDEKLHLYNLEQFALKKYKKILKKYR